MAKETGLGKGVNLLFGTDDESTEKEKYFFCNIDNIVPNKHQPRTYFKDEDLEELSNSIKENGIIQPLIVKRGKDDRTFELIAGERRLRASKLIGLAEVPVVVNDVEDENILLELALIENIQRTDLNAIEEAEAYHKLIAKFDYTQEETAKRVGKKRSTVANALRLLKLPEEMKMDIVEERYTEGHGRSLLRLVGDENYLEYARSKIINDKLSVRQTEQLVKKLLTQETQSDPEPGSPSVLSTTYCREVVSKIASTLDSKVTISQNGSKGKVSIDYVSQEDLERLVELLAN